MDRDFQIHVFHFRCPYCGAAPEPIGLRDYLNDWAASPSTRVRKLLCCLDGALNEHVNAPKSYSTKKFRLACEKISSRISVLHGFEPLVPFSLIHAATEADRIEATASCPFCYSAAGLRPKDNYFTTWDRACRVQMGNLLYETGLVLWGLLAHLPNWAAGQTLKELNELRLTLRRAGKQGSFLECPQCGRLGNHLYGGLEAETTGFCRWCLDMGGGLPLSFSVSVDADGKLDLKMRQCDYSAPAKNAWDILPPEISKRDRI